MIERQQRAALKRLAGKHSRAELKELFALVRAHDDRTLFATIARPKKAKRQSSGDDLLRDVEAVMKPLVARAAEKGELLVEHLGKASSARGLADAVKKLRAAKLSDAQIRNGAKSLMAELGRKYDGRETVV
jgi:hypothetical protein